MLCRSFEIQSLVAGALDDEAGAGDRDLLPQIYPLEKVVVVQKHTGHLKIYSDYWQYLDYWNSYDLSGLLDLRIRYSLNS